MAERTLADIFCGIEHRLLRGATEQTAVSSIEFSSRDVTAGALFVCVVGGAADGHDYAADAAVRGAAVLVVERELDIDCPQVLVYDTRRVLALASANFFGNPSHVVRVVGITGTNGKTTTAFLTEHLVGTAGLSAGLIGTVECHVAGRSVASEHTTPESRDVQALLAEMAGALTDVCAMEVSSHALALGRVEGTRFEVAAFTNLTQDHLDYHPTMNAYFEAKARLFAECDPKVSVVCTDDESGREIARRVRASGRELICVSARGTDGPFGAVDVGVVSADFKAHSSDVTLAVRGGEVSLTLPLVGRFNVENAVVAFGIGVALGFSTDTIVASLESAPQVPGRLERVCAPDGAVPPWSVLVDYAHTDDSIKKAISAVRAVTEGRVICVFGCGGDRDRAKRPKMGRAALDADFAVVTSDNPRTEDPVSIIDDILPGMEGAEDRYCVRVDRAEAIREAIGMARPGDAVLIAGKGHEDYQIVGTRKHHFDDREVAAECIGETWSR